MAKAENQHSSRQSVKDHLLLRKSKLENKKRHLKNLVAKRERLEIEIKGTLKSLKKEHRKDGVSLRESLDLETEATSDETKTALTREASQDRELSDLIEELDQLAAEIIYLAKPSEILTEQDTDFIKSL